MSAKNKSKKGGSRKGNYSDEQSGNKKLKKSRFNSNRDDKHIQQGLFLD